MSTIAPYKLNQFFNFEKYRKHYAEELTSDEEAKKAYESYLEQIRTFQHIDTTDPYFNIENKTDLL